MCTCHAKKKKEEKYLQLTVTSDAKSSVVFLFLGYIFGVIVAVLSVMEYIVIPLLGRFVMQDFTHTPGHIHLLLRRTLFLGNFIYSFFRLLLALHRDFELAFMSVYDVRFSSNCTHTHIVFHSIQSTVEIGYIFLFSSYAASFYAVVFRSHR